MTRSHFIEILTIHTKYLFDLGVRLTEFSVTVESVTLRFYCTKYFLRKRPTLVEVHNLNSFVLLEGEIRLMTQNSLR